MSGSAVALANLATGIEWLAQTTGAVAVGQSRQVFVYARGTTTPVTVYASSALTTTLTQPLTTGTLTVGTPGGIPGYVRSGQSIDFYDVLSEETAQAEALAAQDVVGSATGRIGDGNIQLSAAVANASQSVQWMPPPSGDATGATDSADFAALLAALPISTEAGSVGYPQGTIQLANAPQSNPYYFGNLGNLGPHVNVVGRGVRSTYCYAANSVAGPMFRFYSNWYETYAYAVPAETTRGGGALLDVCIDGTNAVAGSQGLTYGDVIGFEHRVTVRHYNSAGSIGIWEKGMVKCTEKTDGNSYVYDCTTHFYVTCEYSEGTTTIHANVSLPATTVVLSSLPPSFAQPYGDDTGSTPQIYVNSQVVKYTGITNNGDGTYTLTGCSGGTGSLTAGMTVQGAGVHDSHGYNSNIIRIGANSNQDGVVITNGASYYHGRLVVRGNMQTYTSAQTTGLVVVGGQPAAGLTQATTSSAVIQGGHFEVEAETYGSGSYAPTTFIFTRYGSTSALRGQIVQTQGPIAFSGSVAWTYSDLPAFAQGGFRHLGVIKGDTVLNPDTTSNTAFYMRGPLGLMSAYTAAGATSQLNLNDGDMLALTLTQSTTLSFNTPPPIPQRKIIKLSQPATGGTYNYTVTWPTSGSPTPASPNVIWIGGAPTMSTGAGATDVYELDSFDGATWYGTVLQQSSGTETQRAELAETALSLALLRPGGYYFQGATNINTSNTLGNGTLRLCPYYIGQALTIIELFAEFTVAGDVASIFAPCVYADSGSFYPGSLLITGPTISTGSGNAGSVSTSGVAGVYGGTVSQTMTPGLYWFGGVVQGVTVTQPTMRTALWGLTQVAQNALPAAGATAQGYQQTSVTGALPAPFSTSLAVVGSSTIPRVGFKTQ